MTEREFFDANKYDILKVFEFKFNSAVGIAKRLNLKSFSPKRYYDTEKPQATTIKPLLNATLEQFQEDIQKYNDVVAIMTRIASQYNELS